jgi:hypothetical protein
MCISLSARQNIQNCVVLGNVSQDGGTVTCAIEITANDEKPGGITDDKIGGIIIPTGYQTVSISQSMTPIISIIDYCIELSSKNHKRPFKTPINKSLISQTSDQLDSNLFILKAANLEQAKTALTVDNLSIGDPDTQVRFINHYDKVINSFNKAYIAYPIVHREMLIVLFPLKDRQRIVVSYQISLEQITKEGLILPGIDNRYDKYGPAFSYCLESAENHTMFVWGGEELSPQRTILTLDNQGLTSLPSRIAKVDWGNRIRANLNPSLALNNLQSR